MVIPSLAVGPKVLGYLSQYNTCPAIFHGLTTAITDCWTTSYQLFTLITRYSLSVFVIVTANEPWLYGPEVQAWST